MLSIDKIGIYAKGHIAIKWEDILSIKRIRKRAGSGEDEYMRIFFLIQTKQLRTPIEFEISNLEISEEDIIKAIRGFSDFNIYDATYEDSWEK
jgi:hypothetical protein